MNFFFSASIRGGRSDIDLYAKLIDILNQHGDVLTEHELSAMIRGNDDEDVREYKTIAEVEPTIESFLSEHA